MKRKRNKADGALFASALLMIASIAFLSNRLCLLAEMQGRTIQQQYGEYIEEAAEKYHISSGLIEAIIERESAGIPDVVSPGGDIGLMQVNPLWHKERMDKLGVCDLTEPRGNILVATDYLAELFREYHDLPEVLMRYNGSQDAGYRNETYQLTDYAKSVMRRSEELERAKE